MEKINNLFSIKARSSKEDLHISGGERIVPYDKIEEVSSQLLKRVNRNNPDFISIKIEKIKEKPIILKNALQIKELEFGDYISANKFAIDTLHKSTGIDRSKIKQLIEKIHLGASPNGTNMRGAMIVNQNGERIELDKFRGVRTTYVDFIDRERALKNLLKKGFTTRTLDAILIATKNLFYEDFLAEYCISDEPDYTTGYIAVGNTYYRLKPLKNLGNNKGGRIYFVKNSINLQHFYNYLEKTPILIDFPEEF